MKRIPLVLLFSSLLALCVGGVAFYQWREARKTSLREARQQRIADLKAYVAAQGFPHNHDFEGERVPYLLDRHGMLCAVAYLFAASTVESFNYSSFIMSNYPARPGTRYEEFSGPESGREAWARSLEKEKEEKQRYAGIGKDIRALAAENNQIRIGDLKEGPLWDWILTSGLTLEECALIQPNYSYLCCNDCLPGSEQAGPYGVSHGMPTSESIATAEADRVRIRQHLLAVIQKLGEDTERSLDLAFLRLP